VAQRIAPQTEIDGFHVGERVHAGAMGVIYRVTREGAQLPMVMKVPFFGVDGSAEGLLGFETEAQIMPVLSGGHVPHFIAAGDIANTPYLVIEWIEGESLAAVLRRGRLPFAEVARIGAAIADAVHSLHQQDAIHLDLKPDNLIIRRDGTVALIDFGLAHHARFPDLLAEEERFAAGSAPYVSPEQVQGERADPRSDLFALGVILYEMATGELPFGTPQSMAGQRDRLWMDPAPPRAHVPDLPPWLQEVILRAIEPEAEARYQTAAFIAFDLRHPEQVLLTVRAARTGRSGMVSQLRLWWRSRGMQLGAPRAARAHLAEAPVIMVAVDTAHPEDERQPVLQRVTAQVLSLNADFRLVCVSVVPALMPGNDADEHGAQFEHRVRLRHWVAPLRLPPHKLSLHVLEAANPAGALLEFARRNHVSLIVLGAPGPEQMAMAWWRSVASGVTAGAHCSVHVVRVPQRTGTKR
jgi:nucleotide-binding universal stress UspA family protein